MLIEYSIIKRYAHYNPEFEYNLASTPYEERFPIEISLPNDKQEGIEKLCNRFGINDGHLISAFYWICHWMGTEESSTQKQYINGKVVQSLSTLVEENREFNIERIKLYQLFTKDPILSSKHLLRRKIIKDKVYSEDANLMEAKLLKLKNDILNDSFFSPDNVGRNLELNLLTRGKKAKFVNQLRRAWLRLMFNLLKENTNYSQEDIFVICGWLFSINGHRFNNRRKELIDPTDVHLSKEDISKPLRSLMGK